MIHATKDASDGRRVLSLAIDLNGERTMAHQNFAALVREACVINYLGFVTQGTSSPSIVISYVIHIKVSAWEVGSSIYSSSITK